MSDFAASSCIIWLVTFRSCSLASASFCLLNHLSISSWSNVSPKSIFANLLYSRASLSPIVLAKTGSSSSTCCSWCTTCWVLASVNEKRKEKISKVRELLWRENEKSFAKCKWKVISYKFAGNGNILKSCYSFRKVVTFQKVVIFLTDTIFWKVVIFSKRHNFLDKMGLNRFHWTDMFLAENGYKRKSIFDFLITENFSFLCIYFSLK